MKLMHRFCAVLMAIALCLSLAVVSTSAQGRRGWGRHDNGRHLGWYKHHRERRIYSRYVYYPRYRYYRYYPSYYVYSPPYYRPYYSPYRYRRSGTVLSFNIRFGGHRHRRGW